VTPGAAFDRSPGSRAPFETDREVSVRYRIEIRTRFMSKTASTLGEFAVATAEDDAVTSVEVADRAQLRKLLRRIDELGAELLRLRPLADEASDAPFALPPSS
jgi:hypothetical protein